MIFEEVTDYKVGAEIEAFPAILIILVVFLSLWTTSFRHLAAV